MYLPPTVMGEDYNGQARLLKELQKHGEQFMCMFDQQSMFQTSRKRKANSLNIKEVKYSECPASEDSSEIAYSDWEGISSTEEDVSTSIHIVDYSKSLEAQKMREVDSDRKNFMSSSISKVTRGKLPTSKMDLNEETDIVKEERCNLENDAILQRMIHTELLSGSLKPELDLTSAQRQKALAGRIEEIAGSSMIGKGEDAIRKSERNRLSKHIRDGIRNKRAKVHAAKIAESKELGNYHPSLKKSFADMDEATRPIKRVRGLKLGVGRFKGGVLHLSRDDLSGLDGRSKDYKARKTAKTKR